MPSPPSGMPSAASVRRVASATHPATRARAVPRRARRPQLAPDDLVGLAGVTTPLGVADDDPGHEAGEHRCCDLARVGAGGLVMDVLGAARHTRPASRRA